MDFTHMDWQAVWEEEFAKREISQGKRLRDDTSELAFWEQLAPYYDEKHRLDKEVPGLLSYLKKVVGTGFVREIGPGTGNFTIPLAKETARWEGIEFSSAMQKEVERKIMQAGWHHIRIRSGKWEDISIEEPADVLLAVNSLYRMERLQDALDKMIRTTREKLILVRTLQYQESVAMRFAGAVGHVYPDFYLMVNMLWARGFDVEVRFFPFWRKYDTKGMEGIEASLDSQDEKGRYRLLKERVATACVSL